MNFIFSHGIRLCGLSTACVFPGRLLADKFKGDGETALIFDGQASSNGHFAHALLNNEYIESTDSGVFCFGRVPRTGTAIFETDALGQYPLYFLDTAVGYAVSNNILLLKRALEANGIKPTPSFWPAAENMVFGGVLGGETHYAEIKRIPYGVYLEAAAELRLRPVAPSEPVSRYEDAIRRARHSIAAHIASVPAQDFSVADVTGGGDSRLVLSFLLESQREFAGRCLTQYPHPDGNVAGLLLESFRIPVGPYPVPQSPIEASIRLNAGICGGARDVGFGAPRAALTNFVHFRGLFGELGGATPGVDYITEADGSPEEAVNLLLARRNTARAYELLTREAVEEVRGRLVEHYSDLCAQYPLDHVNAEFYLRTRCRTHFGLLAYLDNRSRICPDPLANRWIVEARRLLPGRLHTKNKVIFDLMRQNRPDLLYLPMAGNKWAEEIVPEPESSSWHEMQVITAASSQLSEMRGPLAKSIGTPGIRVDPVLPAAPAPSARVYPHDIYIEPFKIALRFVLDNLQPGHDFWTGFDRPSVEAYIQKPVEDFAKSGIDTHAMGILAASAMSALDLGVGLPEMTGDTLRLMA